MRKMFLAGSAALALIAVPAATMAQGAADQGTGDMPPAADMAPGAGATMSADQQAKYDAMSAEQRSDYDTWPGEYQSYYWTLSPEQQQGYWALTPDQRGQIYRMSPEQRQAAWTSVMQQLAGQTPTTPPGQANPPGEGMPTAGVPAPQTAEQAVRPAMPADESYQGGPYKGALTPPPATAMNKDYPVCSKTVQDNCRNPGGV